jgi:hypothetical protein
MFDWDIFYADLVDYYAAVALRPGWRSYVREYVKEKQKHPELKNFSKDVGKKIKELHDRA